MKMTMDELDRESLKELRDKRQERKKAQARRERELQRMQMDEEYRLLYSLQRETGRAADLDY